MATVIDVPSALGEYMLKGWVLTDITCKKCSRIPLMRSPTSSTTYFCAGCDGGPAKAPTQNAPSQASTSSSLDSIHHDIELEVSRPSTPPTEVSSTLSSPTFAPPIDIEAITRRRQQSDLASAEIGKRLLKGWAMLADECPNSTCYGIPLVRPPKQNGEQDPRKECVICNRTYIDRANGGGLERLVTEQAIVTDEAQPSQYTNGTRRTVIDPTVDTHTGSFRHTSTTNLVNTANRSADLARNSTPHTLETTAQTLEKSLQILTEKLKLVSADYTSDTTSIGQTADAITKVTQAIIKVKELQWSERLASQA